MKNLSNSELIIGIIYSNACHHCITLLPKWKRMKTNIKTKIRLNQIKDPMYLEIDADNISKLNDFNNENRERLGKDITYSGFPTVFKIYGNNIEYYEGSREPKAMETFFMKEIYSKNKVSIDNRIQGGRIHINSIKNNTKKKTDKKYKKSYKNNKILEKKSKKRM
jgi:hypothetical protein